MMTKAFLNYLILFPNTYSHSQGRIIDLLHVLQHSGPQSFTLHRQIVLLTRVWVALRRVAYLFILLTICRFIKEKPRLVKLWGFVKRREHIISNRRLVLQVHLAL